MHTWHLYKFWAAVLSSYFAMYSQSSFSGDISIMICPENQSSELMTFASNLELDLELFESILIYDCESKAIEFSSDEEINYNIGLYKRRNDMHICVFDLEGNLYEHLQIDQLNGNSNVSVLSKKIVAALKKNKISDKECALSEPLTKPVRYQPHSTASDENSQFSSINFRLAAGGGYRQWQYANSVASSGSKPLLDKNSLPAFDFSVWYRPVHFLEVSSGISYGIGQLALINGLGETEIKPTISYLELQVLSKFQYQFIPLLNLGVRTKYMFWLVQSSTSKSALRASMPYFQAHALGVGVETRVNLSNPNLQFACYFDFFPLAYFAFAPNQSDKGLNTFAWSVGTNIKYQILKPLFLEAVIEYIALLEPESLVAPFFPASRIGGSLSVGYRF